MFGIRTRMKGVFGETENNPSPQEAYDTWDEMRPTLQDADLNAEELAALLSNERRNILISALSFGGSNVTQAVMPFDDLVESVAANEIYRGDEEVEDVEEIEPDENHLRNVRDSLKRTHLPRLSEHDIAHYESLEVDDAEVEVVSAGENFRPAFYALNDLAGYSYNETNEETA